MIVSLLSKKEGRVMDIWTNVLAVRLAMPLWAVCLIIIRFFDRLLYTKGK
jgi:hypothetical protein